MAGLRDATGHPLARETRLQLIIFGLQVLRFSSSGNTMSYIQYKLKDQILSGALSWFCNTPRSVKLQSHLSYDPTLILLF